MTDDPTRAELHSWIDDLDAKGLQAVGALKRAYVKAPGPAANNVLRFSHFLHELLEAAEEVRESMAPERRRSGWPSEGEPV